MGREEVGEGMMDCRTLYMYFTLTVAVVHQAEPDVIAHAGSGLQQILPATRKASDASQIISVTSSCVKPACDVSDEPLVRRQRHDAADVNRKRDARSDAVLEVDEVDFVAAKILNCLKPAK